MACSDENKIKKAQEIRKRKCRPSQEEDSWNSILLSTIIILLEFMKINCSKTNFYKKTCIVAMFSKINSQLSLVLA